MSIPHGAERTSRRAPGLVVEALETRALLSVLPIAGKGAGVSHAPGPSVAALTFSSAAGPQPTPHELAREQFVGKIAAHFDVGPGRFTDQSRSIFLLGSGGSTMASHTNLQLIAFTPVDTVNGIITGQAALSGRNIGNTGNELALDLTGDPQSVVDGRPTHFTWTVSGSSGGLFSGASGLGTLDIHYIPGGKTAPRAFVSGTAFAVFRGMVNVVGVFNDLAAPGNRPKNP